MEDFLIGRDPERIEDIWQTLYRSRFYRGGPGHDERDCRDQSGIVGHQRQAARRPGLSLLGGAVRDKMRVYSWIGGDRPSDVAKDALQETGARLHARSR